MLLSRHGVLPILLLLGSPLLFSSQAFAGPAALQSLTDSDSTTGVATTLGTGTTGNSASTGSTGSGTISIPCLDDAGKATSGIAGCNAILPKCSDLKSGYEKSVKTFLAWKIWGYYQGKNIDLNASKLDTANPTLVGPDLMYPICSVVGHKMQYTGNNPLKSGGYTPCDQSRKSGANVYQSLGFEFSKQTIGLKAACGARPDTQDGGDNLKLSFRDNNGNLWNAWLVGAYPWLIRRHAYDVLTALKPDLSNLNDVVASPTVKKDMADLNNKMNSYYAGLTQEAKDACSAGGTDLVDKCNTGKMSLTDPANRLCTLVKAQSTVNNGALPNMLVMEIMARVQTDYDRLFSTLLSFNGFPSKNLSDKCMDNHSGGLFGHSNRGNKARGASCMFDGGDFYSYGDKSTSENNCKGKGSRHGSYPVLARISNGSIDDAAAIFGGVRNADTSHAMLMGFGGVIETVIRRDVCKQQHSNDVSICDTVNIPDDPKEIQ